MKNLLFGPVGQWALKWGLSKSGVLITTVVAQLVAWLIAWLGLPDILPPDALVTIEKALREHSIELGLAVQGIVYAKLVSLQKRGIEAMQVAINQSDTPVTVKVDGVAGNETVKAAAKVADVPVADVVEAVQPAAAADSP